MPGQSESDHLECPTVQPAQPPFVSTEFGGGGGGGHFGVHNLPVNGPWLTGSYGLNNATTGPWRTYGKTSQVIGPHPDSLWLVIEESIYSLNDATFAMSVGVPKWVDYVGTRHHGGCVVSFVDGHCQLHTWRSACTFLN